MDNMSDRCEKNDMIIKTNEVVKKSISKIKNKLISIKENFVLNEEENFDNIYCKINIYFTSLINKIKIKYIEALNKYRTKIKQMENDILELMVENMLLTIENNFLKENSKPSINKVKNDFKENKNNNNNKLKYNSVDNFINILSYNIFIII